MMEPKVRQMIVCEDARIRAGSQGKIDILGLMSKVTAKSFPCNHTLAVYLCLTDGRGIGQGRIDVRKAMTGNVVYKGVLHEFELGSDPLRRHPFMIRVFSCPLPEPGWYAVEFVYNEIVLESCELLVEKAP